MNFRNKPLVRFALVTVLGVFGLASVAKAGVITTLGGGSAVTSANAAANFNTLINGSSLASYTENGLSVTIPTPDFVSFDPTNGNGDPDGAFLIGGSNGGFFYANGKIDPVIIQLVGGGKMSGVEFDVGNGVGTTQTFLAYITNDGSGVVSVLSGSVIGFSDPAGLSFLNVGAYGSLATAQAELSQGLAGADGNSLALDNLREQTVTSAAPEPGTGFLLVIALIVALLSRARRTARTDAA